MDNNKSYGYESGYGSAPQDTSAPNSTGYGYESGYGTTSKDQGKPWYQDASDVIGHLQSKLTPDIWDKVSEALSQRPELQPYGTSSQEQPSSVVGSALQAAGKTLEAPIRTGATLASAPDVVGEGVSNQINESGYPKTGALVGTAIQMAPALATARVGWNAMQESTNPVLRGLINTPKELSPQYTAQNKAIGISDKMPESSGGKTTFPNPYGNTLSTKPPPALNVDTDIQSNLRGAEPLPSTTPLKYPSNNEAFINYASKRLSFGDQLNSQELSDIKYKADGAITAAKQALQSNAGDKAAKTLLAKASQVRTQSNNLLNQVASEKLPQANLPSDVIQTRPGLNTAYGIASKQKSIQDLIKSIPKYTSYGGGAIGGLGAAGYGIKKVYDYLAGNR